MATRERSAPRDQRGGQAVNESLSDALSRIRDRADREKRAGRLWRAREILQGALRTHHDDLPLLEQYGRLLNELGDRVEGGKYLFLSGAEGADVDEAVELFLERHGRGDRRDLVNQFPRRIRHVPLGELPPRVSEHLRSLGIEPPKDPRKVSLGGAIHAPRRWKDWLWSLGCAVVAGFLFVACLIGAVTIIGWLGRL